MGEALSAQELQNPGSFNDFVSERSHPAVLTDLVKLRKSYNDALARYRQDLADSKGISLEELHAGNPGLLNKVRSVEADGGEFDQPLNSRIDP